MSTTNGNDSSIPLIDLKHYLDGTDEESVVRQVAEACANIGFFAIQNHGIDPAIVARALLASRDFFDLPQGVKVLATPEDSKEYPYGYENSENLELAKTGTRSRLEDLKETFSIGPYNPASGMPPRRFPDKPEHLQGALEEYYAAMEGLALKLLEILARGLGLEASWFENKMDRHESALRILNYPELTEPPQPGQLRASAHTDYGALTILKTGGPGLQVRKDMSDEAWVDAPEVEDGFIINLGDLMQRWTNDKWVSTLHRVQVPPFDGNNQRRQSIAFFVAVNGDTVVLPIETCVDEKNPPKYEKTTARKHLLTKYLKGLGLSTDHL